MEREERIVFLTNVAMHRHMSGGLVEGLMWGR